MSCNMTFNPCSFWNYCCGNNDRNSDDGGGSGADAEDAAGGSGGDGWTTTTTTNNNDGNNKKIITSQRDNAANANDDVNVIRSHSSESSSESFEFDCNKNTRKNMMNAAKLAEKVLAATSRRTTTSTTTTSNSNNDDDIEDDEADNDNDERSMIHGPPSMITEHVWPEMIALLLCVLKRSANYFGLLDCKKNNKKLVMEENKFNFKFAFHLNKLGFPLRWYDDEDNDDEDNDYDDDDDDDDDHGDSDDGDDNVQHHHRVTVSMTNGVRIQFSHWHTNPLRARIRCYQKLCNYLVMLLEMERKFRKELYFPFCSAMFIVNELRKNFGQILKIYIKKVANNEEGNVKSGKSIATQNVAQNDTKPTLYKVTLVLAQLMECVETHKRREVAIKLCATKLVNYLLGCSPKRIFPTAAVEHFAHNTISNYFHLNGAQKDLIDLGTLECLRELFQCNFCEKSKNYDDDEYDEEYDDDESTYSIDQQQQSSIIIDLHDQNCITKRYEREIYNIIGPAEKTEQKWRTIGMWSPDCLMRNILRNIRYSANGNVNANNDDNLLEWRRQLRLLRWRGQLMQCFTAADDSDGIVGGGGGGNDEDHCRCKNLTTKTTTNRNNMATPESTESPESTPELTSLSSSSSSPIRHVSEIFKQHVVEKQTKLDVIQEEEEEEKKEKDEEEEEKDEEKEEEEEEENDDEKEE